MTDQPPASAGPSEMLGWQPHIFLTEEEWRELLDLGQELRDPALARKEPGISHSLALYLIATRLAPAVKEGRIRVSGREFLTEVEEAHATREAEIQR